MIRLYSFQFRKVGEYHNLENDSNKAVVVVIPVRPG